MSSKIPPQYFGFRTLLMKLYQKATALFLFRILLRFGTMFRELSKFPEHKCRSKYSINRN